MGTGSGRPHCVSGVTVPGYSLGSLDMSVSTRLPVLYREFFPGSQERHPVFLEDNQTCRLLILSSLILPVPLCLSLRQTLDRSSLVPQY